MENVTEMVYMAAGGIIFALGISALLWLDDTDYGIYAKAMKNSSADEILWWSADE